MLFLIFFFAIMSDQQIIIHKVKKHIQHKKKKHFYKNLFFSFKSEPTKNLERRKAIESYRVLKTRKSHKTFVAAFIMLIVSVQM